MNLDEILKYKPPKQNYYEILGCDQSSAIEQINREYKIKALQLHPDKNPDPESLERFRCLQEAKDILSDESSRNSYDRWLNSRIQIPFEQWQNRKGRMMHWTNPRQANLSIKADSSSMRQGSEFKLNNNHKSDPVNRETRQPENVWLDKFRKYEI